MSIGTAVAYPPEEGELLETTTEALKKIPRDEPPPDLVDRLAGAIGQKP